MAAATSARAERQEPSLVPNSAEKKAKENTAADCFWPLQEETPARLYTTFCLLKHICVLALSLSRLPVSAVVSTCQIFLDYIHNIYSIKTPQAL